LCSHNFRLDKDIGPNSGLTPGGPDPIFPMRRHALGPRPNLLSAARPLGKDPHAPRTRHRG